MNLRKKEFWITIGLLVITLILVNLLRYSRMESTRLPGFALIPMQSGNWSGQEYFFTDQTYELIKADASTLRRYANREGKELYLFISYFKSQKYGSQIHSPKNCLPGSGWKILTREKTRIQGSSGASLLVNRLLISDSKSQEVMYYWFQTRSGLVTSELGLKLDLVINSLKRAPTDAAFIRINLPLNEVSEKEALVLVEDFLRNFQPGIENALPF
ncbi:MAG TPA: EpsI family protein [Terriglobales bacterium]|nr:EpsI family protein [Terriglobales bacterium]